MFCAANMKPSVIIVVYAFVSWYYVSNKCLGAKRQGRIGQSPLWEKRLDFRQCVILCHQDSRCGGFTFQPGDKLCKGYRIATKTHFKDRNGRFYNLCRQPVCPKSKGFTLLRPSGLCVKVRPYKQTWEEARKICQAESTDLVVVNSQEKYDSVMTYLQNHHSQLMTGQHVWVGMRRHGGRVGMRRNRGRLGMRRHGNVKYFWVRDQSSWVTWAPLDPNYMAQECVETAPVGMRDAKCHRLKFFMCELYET